MATVRRSYVYQSTSAEMLVLQAAASAAVGPMNLRTAIQISYDDTVAGIVADLDSYMQSIGYVPGDGKIATDPTLVATDVPMGSLIVDANGMWWRKRDDGSTTNVDKITDPTELLEMMPIPEGRTGGNGSLAAPLTLVGASFLVPRRCLMNRLVVRLTGGGGVTSFARILLYQADDGAAQDPTTHLVSLIGKITAFNAPSGSADLVASFDGGVTVDIQKGLLYVLWGRESGSAFTFRSYLTQAMDLQNANVDLDTHPTQFTTTIAATGTPAATFDPRQAPTGAATATSASDAALAFRLKKL